MKRMSVSLLAVVIGFGMAQTSEDHNLHHGPASQLGQAQMGPGMGMMRQVTSELDFIQHMIAHHQEAVESARSILELSERAEVQALAEDIISVQREEIATLEGWLEQWYPGEAQEVDYQPMMRDFSDLSSAEADRMFIEDMIAHHRMAVMDAQQLLMRGLAEHDEVAAMARDIVTVQTQEIADLQSWLQEWYGSTTTSPGMMQGMPGMMGQGMTGEGMMGQGMMGQGMAGMHGMMQQCMAMMQGMHHQMHGGMGQGMMGQMPMQGMMNQSMMNQDMMRQGASYNQQTVEALAQAFLAGSQQDAEITQIEPPANVYTVTFRSGDTTGRLTVNADTGEVRLENNSD